MQPLRFAFFGSSAFGLPSLDALTSDPRFQLVAVITQPPRPSGRGKILTATPIAQWAKEKSILLLEWASIKNDLTIEKQLADLNCDFMLVASYGCIVPANLLALTKGWINLHASLLPRHRGASPIVAAIACGDEKSGVTIMQMDSGIDTGPVFTMFEQLITTHMTSPELETALAQLPTKQLGDMLYDWTSGKTQPQPQPATGATYAAKLAKEDGHANWNSATEWERKIRAYQPWPGVWTLWNNERVSILAAQAEPGTASATLGTIEQRPAGWGIVCADGWLIPTIVQRQGKNPIPAANAGRDWPGLIGSRLI